MEKETSTLSTTRAETIITMETMKAQVNLSEYAFVACSLNLMDASSSVVINKKPFGKDVYSECRLTADEWRELAKAMSEIRHSALQMNERANNEGFGGDATVLPQNLTKILSQRMMALLNLFQAPTKTSYVTLAVRPYVIDKEQSYKMTKEGGVTLNFKELCTLADSTFQIQGTCVINNFFTRVKNKL